MTHQIAYYGTKRVYAMPMTRQEYNDYRGWELPADEDGADEGYLVEYTDGGKSNHALHAGYISWSPKEQFEGAYQSTEGMSFGHAIAALKAGNRVARAGWNGKGMWLILVQGFDAAEDDVDYVVRDDSNGGHVENLKPLPWIGMCTVDQGFVPWLASQTDMLAEDWVEL